MYSALLITTTYSGPKNHPDPLLIKCFAGRTQRNIQAPKHCEQARFAYTITLTDWKVATRALSLARARQHSILTGDKDLYNIKRANSSCWRTSPITCRRWRWVLRSTVQAVPGIASLCLLRRAAAATIILLVAEIQRNNYFLKTVLGAEIWMSSLPTMTVVDLLKISE